MSVDPKEKKAFDEMFDSSEAAGSDIPDGTYQFEIVGAEFGWESKKDGSKGRPQFHLELKIVAGDEEFVGKTIKTRDNLETAENIGWFKKKLQRLNLRAEGSDVRDGTLAEQIKGKVFEGQAKTKNDFLNVYVNRLLSEGDESAASTAKSKVKKEKEAEAEEKPEAAKGDIETGDTVTWGEGKEGEVVEILADEEQARIKKGDDTIVRVALEFLKKKTKSKAAKGKGDEEEEEKPKEGDFNLPEADEVEDMKMSKVKEALEAIGFDVDEVESPRLVLHAFCVLAADPDEKIELEEMAPLAAALEVETKKGDIKGAMKALSAAVKKKLG